MNALLHLFQRLLCFLGWHHEHDLNSEINDQALLKLPPGMKIEGTFCCRCYNINIKSVEIEGKKKKVHTAGVFIGRK